MRDCILFRLAISRLCRAYDVALLGHEAFEPRGNILDAPDDIPLEDGDVAGTRGACASRRNNEVFLLQVHYSSKNRHY